MPFVDLFLMKFVPGQSVPPGFAAINSGSKNVRINSGDYPLDGGKLEVFSIIPYVIGESTNLGVANQIAIGLNFATDGKIQLLIKNPALEYDFLADLAAANEVALKSQPEITLVIVTREDGWDLGDEVRFIDPNANPPINILLTVQNINEDLKNTVGIIEEYEYTITCANYVVDPTNLIGTAYSLASLPRLRGDINIAS